MKLCKYLISFIIYVLLNYMRDEDKFSFKNIDYKLYLEFF